VFDRFTANYRVSERASGSPIAGEGLPAAAELFTRFGGCTFDDGLYRIHTPPSSIMASDYVAEAFPDFRARASCFGFDWLGRQFSLDAQRGSPSDPEILMFEPGTGEVLQIPTPFSLFHDHELVDYRDAALAAQFFAAWRAGADSSLGFDQCVGYKVPLFLSGKDVVNNLEVIDLDVYWTVLGQLRLGIQSMTPGSTVAGLTINE
jgi:hypothetical protein